MPGFPPVAADYRPPSVPYIDAILKRKEVINWSRIPQDLPDDLSVAEVPFLKGSIKSFLAIPLVAGEAVIGAGVFGTYSKERIWPDSLVQRILFLGQITANTLMRMRDDQALLDEMNRRHEMEKRNTTILIEERLAIESLISDFSATLIRLSAGGLSAALKPWLKRLALFLDVDRCIVTQYSIHGNSFQVIQAYAAPGLRPIPADPRPRPETGFEKYIKKDKYSSTKIFQMIFPKMTLLSIPI